jgi:hypothetical protein
MNDDLKTLEERVRNVERHNHFVVAGGAVLAVCCVAFLGIEYWRVPKAVEAAADARIDREIVRKVEKASAVADQFLARVSAQSGVESTPGKPKRGFTYFGDILLCWGEADLPPNTTVGDGQRIFDFEFAEEFAQPPTINEGINVNSTGYTFGVYKHELTTKTYKGHLYRVTDKAANTIPVRMSYIAIGKAAKQTPK